MEKIFYVKGDEISLETTVPAQTLLDLDVEFKENDYGRGKIEVFIIKSLMIWKYVKEKKWFFL